MSEEMTQVCTKLWEWAVLPHRPRPACVCMGHVCECSWNGTSRQQASRDAKDAVKGLDDLFVRVECVCERARLSKDGGVASWMGWVVMARTGHGCISKQACSAGWWSYIC